MVGRIASILLLLSLLISLAPATIPVTAKPITPKQNPSLPIAIIGDLDNDIKDFLTNEGGYDNIQQFSDYTAFKTALDSGNDFSVAIFNLWGDSDPGRDAVIGLIQEMDNKNIPVIWLDSVVSYGTEYYGGYVLYLHYTNVGEAGYPAPSGRDDGYEDISYWGSNDNYLEVQNTSHPIFTGVGDTYYIAPDTATYSNYACYLGFHGPTPTDLADLYAWDDYDSQYESGIGVAEWTADGGEKWIFISYGASYYHHYVNQHDLGGGYYSDPFSDDAKQVFLNAVEYAINSKPGGPAPGSINGYVYDYDTHDPIEGATVCADGVCNVTDASGYYELNNVPSGTRTVVASKLGYFRNTSTVDVPEGGTVTHNIYLRKKPLGDIIVAVIGDESNDLYNYLDQNYSVISYASYSDFLAEIDSYEWDVVVLNEWSDSLPSRTDVINFLKALDQRDIPLIVLDTYGSVEYYGGYVFTYYSDEIRDEGYPAPVKREYGAVASSKVYVHVLDPSHPIFQDISYDRGDNNYSIHGNDPSLWAYYAHYVWPEFYNLETIALVVDTYNDREWSGIAYWVETTHNNGGEYWFFISYGANYYHGYSQDMSHGQFNETPKKVLNNTVYYVATHKSPAVKVKLYGWVKDADTGDPVSGATIYIEELGLSNTTDSNGYYEIRNIDGGRTYTVKISHPDYIAMVETVSVATTDTEHNITLTPKSSAKVAVIGDINDDLKDFLNDTWYVYTFTDYNEFLNDLLSGNTYDIVIINTWGSTRPSADDVIKFLKIIDAYNIPLIVLDTWSSAKYYGGYIFAYYSDEIRSAGYPAPLERKYNHWTYYNIYVNVLDPSHPIFNGVSYDAGDNSYYITTSGSTYYTRYTWTGDVTVLANVTDMVDNVVGASIVEWEAHGGEKWLFISYGANYYHGYVVTMSEGLFSDNVRTVMNNAIDYLLGTRTAPGTATIYGYVFNASSGQPLSGASIEALYGTCTATTDANGYYSLTVPAGIDKVEVTYSYPTLKTVTKTVDISPGGSFEVNVSLEILWIVGIVGDYDDTDLKQFLEQHGYYVETYDSYTDVLSKISEGYHYLVVIINMWGSSTPSDTDVVNFLKTLDSHDISIIFLDTYSWDYPFGGYVMYQHSSAIRSAGYVAPINRTEDYVYGDEVYVKVLNGNHTIFSGVEINETIGGYYFAEDPSSYADYAAYTFDPSDLVDVIANISRDGSSEGAAIVIWYPPGGERWVFISYGAAYWIRYSTTGGWYDNNFTDAAKQVIINTIEYARIHSLKIDVVDFHVETPYPGNLVEAGKPITIWGRVMYRSGKDRYPLANAELTVYIYSSPIPIGTVTTDSTGHFNATLTIPENAPGGAHLLGIGGDGVEIYIIETPPVNIIPTPEPPVTVLLLLVSLLAVIAFIGRRKRI